MWTSQSSGSVAAFDGGCNHRRRFVKNSAAERRLIGADRGCVTVPLSRKSAKHTVLLLRWAPRVQRRSWRARLSRQRAAGDGGERWRSQRHPTV
jgi:hypothetical protein